MRGNNSSYLPKYNPESLISLSEDPLGPYDHRHFSSLAIYDAACNGGITPDEILLVAPRVAGNPYTSIGPDKLTVEEARNLKELREVIPEALFVGTVGEFLDAVCGMGELDAPAVGSKFSEPRYIR